MIQRVIHGTVKYVNRIREESLMHVAAQSLSHIFNIGVAPRLAEANECTLYRINESLKIFKTYQIY